MITTSTPTPSYVIPTIPSELGIPGIVLTAYRAAQGSLAVSDPSCHVDWPMLAGIGKVESGHARNGQVGADGTTFEPIIGPVLDGSGPNASIPDSDDGRWDGDTVWDHAVGPMQFIPGTWRFIGADGNGDGVASPHNVFDAALAAGRYLCAGSRDLSVRSSLTAALLTYNHSDAYVALVMAWIDGYRAGHVTPLPPQPSPPPAPPTTPPATTPPTTAPTSPPTTVPPTSTSPTATDPTTTAPTTTPPINGPPTFEPPPTTDPIPSTTSAAPTGEASEPGETTSSAPSSSPPS